MNYYLFQKNVREDYKTRSIRIKGFKNDLFFTYKGFIDSENPLEAIFTMFNGDNRPTGQYATSLSVGDVVKLDDDYYHCKSFGWEKINSISVSKIPSENRNILKLKCIEALNKLNVIDKTIIDFEINNKVQFSKEPYGYLYWVNENMQKIINRIEEDENRMVYHVIQGKYKMSDNDFINMTSFLYVSLDNQIDFEVEFYEEENLFIVNSFVIGFDQEFGSIGVKPKFGGLTRVY